jgi:hypothetical protein
MLQIRASGVYSPHERIRAVAEVFVCKDEPVFTRTQLKQLPNEYQDFFLSKKIYWVKPAGLFFTLSEGVVKKRIIN